MKLLSLLFFPLAFLYEELLLRGFAGFSFADYHVALIAGFSAAYGLMTWLLLSLLRSPKARTLGACLSLFLLAAVISTEYTVYGFFKTFFDLRTMFTVGGDATTQFAAETATAITNAIPMILLSFVPLILFLGLRKAILTPMDSNRDTKAITLAVAVLLDILLLVPMVAGSTLPNDRDHLLYEYTPTGAIPRFGVVTALRMETTYAVFGTPVDFLAAPIPTPAPEEAPDEPAEYGYNVTNIDFAALQQSAADNNLSATHAYFGTLAPTRKNEYTGMFEGKNLVYFVAEGFSPYVISEELTPTLYKLANEGFVFNNYYQPDWHQSTTGGEFAALTGLTPTWVDGQNSFAYSKHMDMPYALGHQFSKIGYTANAYHNHNGTYYNRHITHPNLGYDFKGINVGLELPTNVWPRSDLELLQATIDPHIEAYVTDGQPFHVYYMTVSGHTGYTFEMNKQSLKHEAEVADLDYSRGVRAYIACQLELEAALTYLMAQLEAAGIADDTVIALTADHYPYGLNDKQYHELEPVDTNIRSTERYRNSFLLWSGSITQPIEIDDPCSSIDIVPTLSNLFGLEYDSRLYSGRDILDQSYDVTDPNSRLPFVVTPDDGVGHSWVSTIGRYEAYNQTFTPNPGYEDYAENKEYLSALQQKAKNMFKFTKRMMANNYYALVLGSED